VTATARKLACLVWRLLTHGAEYVRQGLDEYEGRVKAKLAQALRRKAAALGYELVAKPAAAPA
jgi:transposase